MKLMGKFESPPPKPGIYSILNTNGVVGIGIWVKDKWYSLPDKTLITTEFWWINYDEDLIYNEKLSKKDILLKKNLEEELLKFVEHLSEKYKNDLE